MKTTVYLIFTILILGNSLVAKTENQKNIIQTDSLKNLSSLLFELGNGIKPEFFKKAWAKEYVSWMNTAKTLKNTDIDQARNLLLELLAQLNSNALNKEVGIKQLKNAFNPKKPKMNFQSALVIFIKGLDKNALKPEFAERRKEIVKDLKTNKN